MRLNFSISIGVMSVLLGVGILINPKFHHRIYSVTFDFTETKWLVGGAFILFGGASLVFGLKGKSNRVDHSYWICPACQETFKLVNDNRVHKCQYCGEALEDLEGFYDRHPNLK